MDLAELGLSVRSDGVVIADKRLDGLARGAKKAETATGRLIAKTEKMNATMKKMGRGMAMFATLPILGIMGGAIKAFGNFDEAMVSSMAIMGDLSDTMKKDMADTAKEVALTTAFSAKQAAESYYFLASAGLTAAESIAALPKVAKFAQAGTFDMAKATDILTDAQSALGKVIKGDAIKNMEEMVKLSDVLVKANTVANASVQQFGEALTNKAGTAMKLLNIDVETGVAVLAAWADQGIKATEAGEKFNIVTRDLQTAYRKNTEEFTKMGVEVFKEGKFQNMADIIGQLETALAPMTVEMQGTTLALMGFQDRSVMAIKSLLGLSEKIRGYEGDMRDAGDITEDVANKQMQTFNKQMGLMKDKLVNVGIELGEKLVPLMEEVKNSLDDFITWLSEAVDTFASYDVETQKMILGAVAFVAAIGPILIVLGWLTSAIITLTPLIVGLVGAFSVAMPFAAIALGIGLLVDALGDLYVSKLEEAIEATGDFVIALDTLDAKILETNIATVNEQLAIFVKEKKSLIDQINMIEMGDPESYGMQGTELERLRGLLDDVNLSIEQQTRLRDNYNERIGQSSQLAWDEAEAYGEVVAAIGEVVEAAKGLTSDEIEALTEWWHTLRAEMDPVAEAQREFDAGMATLAIAVEYFGLSAEVAAAAVAQLTQNMEDANGTTELLDWLDDLVATADPAAEAARVFKESIIKLDEAIALKPKGTVDRAKAVAQLTKEMEDASGATEKYTKEQEKFAKAMAKFKEYKAMIDPAGAALDEFNEQLAEMNDVRAEMEKNGLFKGDAFWDDVEAGLAKATLGTETLGESLEKAGALAGDALRLIQSSMKENSKEYAAMNVLIQAANVSKAIGAVLNQASGGDPYTAFARMTAMAAAVAALGVSIASFGGAGSVDPTEERQADQGAGSVLGDAEAKSESIMNALDITADATSELVGINRGMLNALRALQTGLTGASTQVIRGGADGSEIPVPEAVTAGWVKLLSGGGILDMLGLNFIGDFISKLLGGKTKLLDTGLEIEGGAITDLINDTMVRAFADIKSKKWFGGTYKITTIFEDLEEGIGKQFALVFGSIVNTVVEAAKAIGIPLDDIQARLELFEVETQKISMEGMTGEEQQEALLAVFSKIFDDLALDIVPFIANFQKVGEGLGETLVRVATSVQVMQEAVRMLGLSLDVTDPEKFAEIAVGMAELAGGIDNFISQLKSFVGKFSTKEWQDSTAIEAVTRGFDQLGITLPSTRDGLWELVQGLDLSTESGRQQLATILELTDSLDSYYSILEDADQIRMDAFNAEVQALLHIQAIAESISASLKALRDRIIGETSTDEENYNRYKAEADALVVDLATMTDPDLINETVKEIERLTNLAWGLLDESQKQKMGSDFLTFLEGVEAIALERLGLAADAALAGTEFTPEEILARFNELVTNPLILVAGLQELAAAKLDAAGDKLIAGTGADYTVVVESEENPDAVPIYNSEEIFVRFNELVTGPLILVAEAQGLAAFKLDSAADKLLAMAGADFQIVVDPASNPDVVENDTVIDKDVLAIEPVQVVVTALDPLVVEVPDPLPVMAVEPIPVLSPEALEVLAIEPLLVAAPNPLEVASTDPLKVIVSNLELLQIADIDPLEAADFAPLEAADFAPLEAAVFELLKIASIEPLGIKIPEPLLVAAQKPLQVAAIESLPVADRVNTSDAIEAAVRAGMQAGAEAMAQAARSIVSSGNTTASATISSARTIAGAVNSIPSRIVVETKQSEFS